MITAEYANTVEKIFPTNVRISFHLELTTTERLQNTV